MAVFNPTQTSFTTGEITPKALGRIDISQYSQACEELVNCYLGTQGGAFMRPGTQFVTDNISGILAETSFIFEYNIGTGSLITFTAGSSVVRRFDIVTKVTVDHTFQATGIRVAFAGYTAAEFPEVRTKLVGNRLYFFHKDHPPWYVDETTVSKMWYHNFVRVGTSTRQVDLDGREWPFLPFPPTSAIDKILSTATTGAVTLSVVGPDVFDAGMIGSPFRFEDGGVVGYAIITAVAGGGGASATVTQTLPAIFAGAGANTYNEPAWSDFRGWPSKVDFFQGRLIAAGPEPDTIYGSQTGDVQEFTKDGSIDNSFPFKFAFNTAEVKQIQWISAGLTLAVGTTGKEHIVQGPDQSLSLGPLNIDATPRTDKGSAFVDAIRFESALLFAQKSGNDILEFIFDFNEQSFRSFGISELADHIFKKSRELFASPNEGKVIKMIVQNSKKNIWFLDNNGQLIVLKRNRELGIFGFSRVSLGGNFNGEPAQVMQIMVTSVEGQVHDDVYLLVKRTVDSSTVVYLEKITEEFIELDLGMFNSSTDLNDKPVYMDSTVLDRPGSPQTIFTGLDHLEGEIVSVISEGQDVGDFTVAAGLITLPTPSLEVIVGLKYEQKIQPVALEAGGETGTSQGKPRRIDTAFIKFYKTVNAIIRTVTLKDQKLRFRDETLPVENPVEPRDINQRVKFQDTYGEENRVIVLNDRPVPMAVLSITSEGKTYD